MTYRNDKSAQVKIQVKIKGKIASWLVPRGSLFSVEALQDPPWPQILAQIQSVGLTPTNSP